MNVDFINDAIRASERSRSASESQTANPLRMQFAQASGAEVQCIQPASKAGMMQFAQASGAEVCVAATLLARKAMQFAQASGAEAAALRIGAT